MEIPLSSTVEVLLVVLVVKYTLSEETENRL